MPVDTMLPLCVGYIVPTEWPMPEGIVCVPLDGRRLWRIDWPELFLVVGTLYGGDNTPAHFNVPNIRIRCQRHGEWGPPSEPTFKIIARMP